MGRREHASLVTPRTNRTSAPKSDWARTSIAAALAQRAGVRAEEMRRREADG